MAAVWVVDGAARRVLVGASHRGHFFGLPEGAFGLAPGRGRYCDSAHQLCRLWPATHKSCRDSLHIKSGVVAAWWGVLTAPPSPRPCGAAPAGPGPPAVQGDLPRAGEASRRGR